MSWLLSRKIPSYGLPRDGQIILRRYFLLQEFQSNTALGRALITYDLQQKTTRKKAALVTGNDIQKINLALSYSRQAQADKVSQYY